MLTQDRLKETVKYLMDLPNIYFSCVRFFRCSRQFARYRINRCVCRTFGGRQFNSHKITIILLRYYVYNYDLRINRIFHKHTRAHARLHAS